MLKFNLFHSQSYNILLYCANMECEKQERITLKRNDEKIFANFFFFLAVVAARCVIFVV